MSDALGSEYQTTGTYVGCFLPPKVILNPGICACMDIMGSERGSKLQPEDEHERAVQTEKAEV